MVEYAITRLMSFCTSPMVAAKTAVTPPVTATTVIAGGDHRRRVDQGAHRRRAFHGVRQPDIERQLGGLAHGADKEEESDERDDAYLGAEHDIGLVSRPGGERGKHTGKIQRTEGHEDKQHSEDEPKI